MESLLLQLHYDSTAISFLKVGSSFNPHSSAGYVSYTDLLVFLSQSTLGSYLDRFPQTVSFYHFRLWCSTFFCVERRSVACDKFVS